MIIENAGPKISTQEVDAIEAELGGRLSPSYRDFLLRYNGGAPTPDTVDVRDAPGTPTDVQVFFGIGRVGSSDLIWNLELIAERCPGHDVLPIACDSGGNLFCLKVVQGIAMEVVYCDLEAENCAFYTVAPGFDEFLQQIRSFEQ